MQTTPTIKQPSDAFWTLYGSLKPYAAGDLVMLAKAIGLIPVRKQTGPEWTAAAVAAGEDDELTADGVSTPEWFNQIDEIPF